MTFRIQGAALELFASYVRDSCQSVIVDDIVSALSPFVYGVPQGSVLVLFILYSQPLLDVISDHKCNFYKYAHNTELLQSAPPDEFHSVQSGI